MKPTWVYKYNDRSVKFAKKNCWKNDMQHVWNLYLFIPIFSSFSSHIWKANPKLSHYVSPKKRVVSLQDMIIFLGKLETKQANKELAPIQYHIYFHKPINQIVFKQRYPTHFVYMRRYPNKKKRTKNQKKT